MNTFKFEYAGNTKLTVVFKETPAGDYYISKVDNSEITTVCRIYPWSHIVELIRSDSWVRI